MAILARDMSVGIDAYMKMIGLNIREVGEFILIQENEDGTKTEIPTGVKNYTAVVELQCFASKEKVGVYNTKFVPIQNLKESELTLTEIYGKVMSLPEFEGSVIV